MPTTATLALIIASASIGFAFAFLLDGSDNNDSVQDGADEIAHGDHPAVPDRLLGVFGAGRPLSHPQRPTND